MDLRPPPLLETSRGGSKVQSQESVLLYGAGAIRAPSPIMEETETIGKLAESINFKPWSASQQPQRIFQIPSSSPPTLKNDALVASLEREIAKEIEFREMIQQNNTKVVAS